MFMRKHNPRHGSRAARAGFTLIELAIVIAVLGLLLVPLLRLTAASIGATRVQETTAALKAARDALIAFAAANGGCLPFASDYEGGYPDTDATGASGGYVDTGANPSSKHGGDLPWADLGLTNSFTDGDGLRIQYYVATPYTDSNGNPSDGIDCLARFRGFEWSPAVPYVGSVSNPLYVYYSVSATDRRLYKITGIYPLGTSPPDAVSDVCGCVEDVTNALPPTLMAVRRGPDITSATNGQSNVLSTRNVFVLVAPGKNNNADHNRVYFRDSNHRGDASGSSWVPDSTGNLDLVVFSNTPNVDATDEGNNGDDTLLVISFVNFKAELNKYGLNMEPVCDAAC